MNKMPPEEWEDEMFNAFVETIATWTETGHSSRLVTEFPEEAPIAIRFEDPAELIELADSVAPRLVYGRIDRFDDEEVNALAERLAEDALGDEDEEAGDSGQLEENADLAPQIAQVDQHARTAARGHRGVPHRTRDRRD
jgi:hypothetical protein